MSHRIIYILSGLFLTVYGISSCTTSESDLRGDNPENIIADSVTNDSASSEELDAHDIIWGYRGEVAPKNWYQLNQSYSACHDGKRQSPINIESELVENMHSIQMNYESNNNVLMFDGHTVKMKFENGSHVVFDSDTFDLMQFHFHTPSEHFLKGEYFPGEVHLVHRSKEMKYLVMSIFIELGDENDLIGQILEHPVETDSAEVNQSLDLLTSISTDKGFYYYQGSFTTPPCSEGVHWLINKSRIEASSAQLRDLLGVEGFNARPVQDPHDRKVEVFN